MTRPHVSCRRARLFLLAILLTLGLVRSTNRAQRRLARRAANDQALIGARARPVRVAPVHRWAVRDGDGAGGQQRFVTRVPPPPCATGCTLAEERQWFLQRPAPHPAAQRRGPRRSPRQSAPWG